MSNLETNRFYLKLNLLSVLMVCLLTKMNPTDQSVGVFTDSLSDYKQNSLSEINFDQTD